MSYAARAERFLNERRGAAAAAEAGDETNERNEETPAAAPANAWWDEPTLRPVPDAADAWDRGMRGAYAPLLLLPPRGCPAPVACSRLGLCTRHAAGRPCRERGEGA